VSTGSFLGLINVCQTGGKLFGSLGGKTCLPPMETLPQWPRLFCVGQLH